MEKLQNEFDRHCVGISIFNQIAPNRLECEMTDIKKFKKGNRTYTRMGRFREVRVGGESSALADSVTSIQKLQLDIDPRVETGTYSNVSFVHRSSEEVILDFSFLSPGAQRGRISSRIILPLKQARVLSQLLKEASSEKS